MTKIKLYIDVNVSPRTEKFNVKFIISLFNLFAIRSRIFFFLVNFIILTEMNINLKFDIILVNIKFLIFFNK